MLIALEPEKMGMTATTEKRKIWGQWVRKDGEKDVQATDHVSKLEISKKIVCS